MRTAILIAAALVSGLAATTVQARDRGINGLIIGAGSGALAGQAIGRDTEATLIGTAIGGVLGYIAGNEMDKAAYGAPVSYRDNRQRPVRRYAAAVPAPRYRREDGKICRETEMLAEIDGRPERVYGIACLENGEWVAFAPARQARWDDDDDDDDDHHHRRKHHARHHKRHRDCARYPRFAGGEWRGL